MLGITLLLIALYLYFKPKYRYISYLIYLSFMIGYGGGFGLTTDAVLGVKNQDMAIVYTFLISAYLVLKKKYRLFPKARFMWWYKLFLCFLVCSIIFSYIYYEFSFYQILQGGRGFLLMFSLPIFCEIKPQELSKLIPVLLWITIITSVLYILQIVTSRSLMPYSGEPSIDKTVGLIRMYNSPALLDFFLALTFVVPQYFGKRVNILRVIFFIALICTFGRTGIFSTVMVVLLSMLFLGKASGMFKTVVIIGVLFIPFIGVISDRFEKGGTEDDISVLKSGGYEDFSSGEGGTMTYRIAWVYERFDYLIHRPIGEQIFGLGLISDSQPLVTKKYNFLIGLSDPETGIPVQLSTPDIAYGNLLTKLGFGGGAIYLCFLISLAIFLYKNRKANALTIVCAAQIIMLFVLSMSGNMLSESKNLTMYFIAIATIFRHYSRYKYSRQKDVILYQEIK